MPDADWCVLSAATVGVSVWTSGVSFMLLWLLFLQFPGR